MYSSLRYKHRLIDHCSAPQRNVGIFPHRRQGQLYAIPYSPSTSSNDHATRARLLNRDEDMQYEDELA